MADFNPATMIDVTRPNISLQAVFTGSIAAATGILSVTSYSSGQIASQMVLTSSGNDAVVVTDKLTPQAGEIERWQTYRIYAGIDGLVADGVLTVSAVWRGSLATLGSGKYLFLSSYAAGAYLMSAASVDEAGLGTYNLTLASGLDISARRMYVHFLANASQTITEATFTGGWDWESVSSTAPTTNQSALIQHIGLAAASSGKGAYFPPGRYVGPASLPGVAVYGRSSRGTDTVRTVLQSDYSTNMAATTFAASRLEDIRLDGLIPGATKTIKNCYLWWPDKSSTFTGSISGTTLTVTAVDGSGFIPVGGTVTGTGVTSCTISAFLSGTAGGVGTYTVSVSQTVAERAMAVAQGFSLFSGDSLATGADYEITDNIFDIPGTYIPLWILNPRRAVVSRNEFRSRSGRHSHVVAIEASDGLAQSIEVTHNKIYASCKTGIFAKSNRYAPIRGLVMDWNEVHKNTEEAIAIDGIGNDPGYCPCICNGRLTSITNDAEGRLVVSLSEFIYATGGNTRARITVATRDQSISGYVVGDVFTVTSGHNGYAIPGSTLKADGIPSGTYITDIISRPGIGNVGSVFRLNRSFTLGSAGSPVTINVADWKKFFFIFSEGTGADGTIVEIYDYDATANTLTLDLFRSASRFTAGAGTWAGVHAGFFGGSCSHNRVSGDINVDLNSDSDYSTGVSLYHNVFNFDIGHNEVAGIKDGINVSGGYMLSTYHVLAYHNNIHDNVVSLAQTGAEGVAVRTMYSGIPQRGNRVVNNNCIQSNVVLAAAADTVCEGNTLVGDNAKVIRTFPTPTLPATDI